MNSAGRERHKCRREDEDVCVSHLVLSVFVSEAEGTGANSDSQQEGALGGEPLWQFLNNYSNSCLRIRT